MYLNSQEATFLSPFITSEKLAEGFIKCEVERFTSDLFGRLQILFFFFSNIAQINQPIFAVTTKQILG